MVAVETIIVCKVVGVAAYRFWFVGILGVGVGGGVEIVEVEVLFQTGKGIPSGTLTRTADFEPGAMKVEIGTVVKSSGSTAPSFGIQRSLIPSSPANSAQKSLQTLSSKP